jgi:integrase
MTAYRSRGDGGLSWDNARQRWVASLTVGYTPSGKRIVKRGRGRTKTEARRKLREILRDYEDGLMTIGHGDYTVAQAVDDWLMFGLAKRDARTVDLYAQQCRTHILPALGARKLRELTATDVDKWLAQKARTLSTRTLRILHSCLNRSVKRAMARDMVKRNVVALCTVPQGHPGRRSKALTMVQAEGVLRAAEGTRMHGYIVLSLLTGARTEELRELRWDHVDLTGDPDANPPVPPHVAVWRSVRAGGDTKTRKSRRTLALSKRCITALERQRRLQDRDRAAAGEGWHEHGLVFASMVGTPLDPSHVRRDFRMAIRGVPGLDPAEWTPRELRHSFVSLLSDNGTPIDEIARLVGHSSTAVTELVYRHQIRPVLQSGAVVMDRIFGEESDA